MEAGLLLKIKYNYTCQKCGSRELIQSHHQIPKDDNSLIVLCAVCHSNEHPNLPKALFFNKLNQPYWRNKSASSIAKEVGVHSRTITRIAKRLNIPMGELSEQDENRIKAQTGKYFNGKSCRKYRLTQQGMGGKSVTTILPPEVVKRNAEHNGLSVIDFRKKYQAVAHYSDPNRVTYTFEPNERKAA